MLHGFDFLRIQMPVILTFLNNMDRCS